LPLSLTPNPKKITAPKSHQKTQHLCWARLLS
jgi:hypothetical protein